MKHSYKRLTWACYTTSASMAVVCNLPPILFLTFRSLYGLSFTLLGLLIFINYTTQLIVDLIFSFFSHKFNIEKTVKFTPVLTVCGLIVYAGWHYLFPKDPYFGLVLGTIIFSAASGLCEVLISPVIAAIPSDDPDREMSKLHSVYAWSLVPVVVLGTLFLLAFGGENWQYLILLSSLLPLTSALLFYGIPIPEMKTPERVSGVLRLFRNKTLWLCVIAIFLGGASECNMSQWVSGYAEQSLGVPKIVGDVFGVALFGFMLGIGRTLYAKFGKNIFRTLIFGFIGATFCYLVACFSDLPYLGLIACAATGFCTSMLWPGTLVVASDKFPKSGVFIYAMMAAGGDMGASVVPQLVGIITDKAITNPFVISLASTLAYSPEQLGMRVGMIVSAVFPLVGIFVACVLAKQGRDSVAEGDLD
ncbi:MAG: MFS transporter [Clostridia bacterium]|nr:MFS transporter [Clostridia bacterium]